ncbi:HupE/UreJ family protein, partial [Rhodoferax sp.]|uniref:HupE/UreJ family protein n=1 Tax=Rhodoferax sp. TaxID=50421 RepID=UPI00374DA8CB
MRASRHSLTIALLTGALPLAASAHTGVDGGLHHDFITGFLHPLTGPDHLAAMVAVGLWSALAARR